MSEWPTPQPFNNGNNYVLAADGARFQQNVKYFVSNSPQSPFPGGQASFSPPPLHVVAVMGATGSGKSTFVNLVSGSNLVVSDSLRACTTTISNSNVFDVNGRSVMLIDTPGFDDTTKSDTEILRMISRYLSTAYEQEVHLSGVLYLQRISDNRVGGSSCRNIRMLRKLCGDDALRNVVIVTTMWARTSEEEGHRREQQLRTDSLFFKELLEQGAQMKRHYNTSSTAQEILQLILPNPTVILRIQREIVDEHKSLLHTAAGADLSRELEELRMIHGRSIADLKRDIEEAQEARDRKWRDELEKERAEKEKKLRETQEALERLMEPFSKKMTRRLLEFWDHLLHRQGMSQYVRKGQW